MTDQSGTSWVPEPDQAEPEEAESVELREVSEDELKEILDAHWAWVESDGKKGKQADLKRTDLSYANFQKANLHKPNLQGAQLFGANLQGARLLGANFQGANLFQAKLQGAGLARTNFEGQEATKDKKALAAANLTGANFRNANLSDAKLSDVTGLLADKLAGADLSNAKLPGDIARFDGLDHVTEISKHARAIFLAVIGACVYSWLTIATTTDVGLLTNSAPTPLPIIQTKVPIAGFYWAAPVILLGLYIYLHLYLQRLWQTLAVLPAVFPEGNSLDQRAYPWLLTSLVNAHVPLLKEKRPPFSRLQVFLSIIAAWVLVPATLGLFWLRYLSRHDWLPTGEQVGILALAIALGIAFYRRARATLRGDEQPDFAWKTAWKSPAIRLYAPLALLFAAAGYGISDGAINGIPSSPRATIRIDPDENPVLRHRVLVPKVLNFFGASPFLDLFEAEISIKPPAWTELETGKELEARIALVKQARLTDRDLRYAFARSAFLVRAELTDARLQGIDLHGANLQGANLQQIYLQGADLRNANLQGADLYGAKLQKAKLSFGDLQGADLSEAVLQGAELRGAKLQRANLSFGDLQGATLVDAKLQGASLVVANLQGAHLFQAKLQGADLSEAVLQGANLRDANFQGANLEGAKGLAQEQLDGACGDHETGLPSPDLTIELCSGLKLEGVDLRTFKGLTQDQLDRSCGDANTKLPPDLEIKPCARESGAKN